MEQTPISRERLTEIYNECGGDLALVAQKLNLSVEHFTDQITPATVVPTRRLQPPTNLGKASMRRFIISVRHADNPCEWPRGDMPAIERGRRLYEAGTHELIQGRDRNWIIQYLIPRKVPTKPRKFYRDIF